MLVERKPILSRYLFMFAVVILLLRPSIIFSSTTVQNLLVSVGSGVAAVKDFVKKRREPARIGNIITRDVEKITIENKQLPFSLFAVKNWLSKLLLALSLLLSQFIFLIRKKGTLFEIVPNNQHYLALSVIRI